MKITDSPVVLRFDHLARPFFVSRSLLKQLLVFLSKNGYDRNKEFSPRILTTFVYVAIEFAHERGSSGRRCAQMQLS